MIWKRLENLFFTDASDTNTSANSLLHSPKAISDLLNRYCNQHHLLTVAGHSPTQSQAPETHTLIKEVDLSKRRFCCEPFTLPTQDDLLFTVSIDDARHQFTTTHMKSESGTEPQRDTDCWLHFPQGIEQIQMRGAFRIKMSQANPIEVTLMDQAGIRINGTLADLSSTGMRVQHQGPLLTSPQCGEVIESCRWILGSDNLIQCQAQVIHWSHDQNQDLCFLGIKFRHMDADDQRILNRYLAQLQRKNRKVS